MNTTIRFKIRGSLKKSIQYPAFVETKYDGMFGQLEASDDRIEIAIIGKAGKKVAIEIILRKQPTKIKAVGEIIHHEGHSGDLYGTGPVRIKLFDIVELEGKDLRGLPLLD